MSEDMTDPNDIKEVMEEDKNMAPDELSKRYNERYKRKMAMMAKMVSFALVRNSNSSLSIISWFGDPQGTSSERC